MRGVLYLASSSPRRSALLQAASIPFVLHPPGDEPEGHGSPVDRAVQRARAKAETAPAIPGEGLVLGVDTLVIADGIELGKPVGRDSAAEMLRRLSGRDHQVVTAHCVVSPSSGCVGEELVASTVRCAELDTARIERYLDAEDWADKAGGYGIQSAAGEFMTLVEGELDTVVGLNVRAVRSLLAAAP